MSGRCAPSAARTQEMLRRCSPVYAIILKDFPSIRTLLILEFHGLRADLLHEISGFRLLFFFRECGLLSSALLEFVTDRALWGTVFLA